MPRVIQVVYRHGALHVYAYVQLHLIGMHAVRRSGGKLCVDGAFTVFVVELRADGRHRVPRGARDDHVFQAPTFWVCHFCMCVRRSQAGLVKGTKMASVSISVIELWTDAHPVDG